MIDLLFFIDHIPFSKLHNLKKRILLYDSFIINYSQIVIHKYRYERTKFYRKCGKCINL